MTSSIAIKHSLPTPEGFKTLRDSAGWDSILLEHARETLKNSILGITAYDDTTLIGMARVVGDGVLNAYIQDVVIAPRYRSQGVGKAVLLALITEMRTTIPANCSIGLMAAVGQEGFYSSFNFITRPDKDYGAGMFAKLADLTDGTLS